MLSKRKRMAIGIVALLAIIALLAGSVAPLFMGGYF